MVYLSSIYTRIGDKGDTALGNGIMVPKNHPRVTAMGTVDELNSILGLFINRLQPSEDKEFLLGIQNNLFDLGADLSLPPDPGQPLQGCRVTQLHWDRLERKIDQWNEVLLPLKSFILPGGTEASSWAHFSRSVCRRAERDLVALSACELINPDSIIFLNRLSDLLFVMARIYNNQGRDDILWVPGKTQ